MGRGPRWGTEFPEYQIVYDLGSNRRCVGEGKIEPGWQGNTYAGAGTTIRAATRTVVATTAITGVNTNVLIGIKRMMLVMFGMLLR